MEIKESLYDGKIIKYITINASAEPSPGNIMTYDNEMYITICNDGEVSYTSLIRLIQDTYSKYDGFEIDLGRSYTKIHIPEEAAKSYKYERKKRTMINKAKNEAGIASYTVKWVEDIDKINDACEIRIMVDQPNAHMRKILIKKIREKWPNNLKINEIPMPDGIYIMIPESLAKETANKQKESTAIAVDKDKDDYAVWHAEMSKHAKIITSSIFCSVGWNTEKLMKSLKFIIDSASDKEMKPEDCLQTFELHYIQSINLIYWGLRLSANMNEQDDNTRNKLHDAIYNACGFLRIWTEEEIESPGVTLFQLIHLLADDKKDENGDFIDLDYEYFGIFGMNLIDYLKASIHTDFSYDDYDAAIDKYNIIAESEHSADAWDIIYKNYIDIYKARHDEQEPDNSPLFTFANDFREWVIFSEIYKSLGINEDETENRYRYYQLCKNQELYNAIYLNINAMQTPDFLTKYEYQVYCAAKSDAKSMQIEPMLFMLLRFHNSICCWKNFMATRTEYLPEIKNFNDTLDFLIKNCKSQYLGYLAKRYL